MKHVKCFTTIRNTTTVTVNTRRHGSVTKSSMNRLVTLVQAEQMLDNCDVTPAKNMAGWSATIKG